MHRAIQWEATDDERFGTQLITESDTEIIGAVTEAAARYVTYVVSWQPVMDSIAAYVATVMAPKKLKLPGSAQRLKVVLTQGMKK